jgi:tRNA nucleotidyltransferase (CCA-adding enzyme)
VARVDPPAPVVEIAERLQGAGHQAWCVGGAVRDALLGHAHLDWDLATSATPTQVQRLFRRTVPVGIEFGTVGVFDRTGRMHEVTTFRRDVRTDGRHAVVEFGASLDEDLARRDFTINAIAFDPVGRRLHDPFGGRDDLAARLVRAVGDPEARLREDRLRALRAIRFASRFDFALDGETWRAIVASAPHLGRLSAERVKQEIEKTLEQVGRPSVAFRLWRAAGAFATVVPPLADVRDATLAAVDALPKPGMRTRPMRRTLRLAALFSELEARSAEQALRALRCSNQEAATVSALLARWHRLREPMREAIVAGDPSDAVVRRWAAEAGRLRVSPLLRLAAACWIGEREQGTGDAVPSAAAVRRLYRRMLRVAFHDPIEVADLVIDGDDLRAAGVRPGPAMGQVLAALLDMVLADPARNERAWLMAQVQRLRVDVGPGA